MKRVAKAVAVVLLLGFLAEVLLRLIPGMSPEGWALERMRRTTWEGNPVMRDIARQEALASLPLVPDPEIGARLAPNLRTTRKTLDYTYTLQTDSFGFANREPWPDTIDVAVLGNSLIVGVGVGLGGQFTTLLERRFPGRTFLNLGNPGGSTETEYRNYLRYAHPRRPKLVIATLWIVWDVSNTVKFAQWLQERPSQTFTEYRQGFGKTRSDDPKRESSGRGPALDILWKSAVVRSSYLTGKALFKRNPYPERTSLPSGEVVDLSFREQGNLVRGVAAAGVPDAGALLMEPLERLRTRVESEGGKLIVVLIPSREEIYGAASVPALLRSIEETRALLAARRLPVLDLYPLFRQRGTDRAPFFEHDMHLNAFGNQLVAEGIGTWIERAGVFKTASPTAAVDLTYSAKRIPRTE